MTNSIKKRTNITPVQATLMAVHFMISGIQVINVNNDASLPVWLPVVFSVIFSAPLILMFARMSALEPDEDMFGMMRRAFGKVAGSILTVLYTLYALYLAAVNLRYMGEYVQVVSLPDTPSFAFLLAVGIFCWWVLRHGAEVFGRFSAVLFPIMTAVWIIILLMSLKLFNFSYALPAYPDQLAEAASTGADIASFSFSEAFLFLCLPCGVKKSRKSSYGVFLTAFGLSAVFIFIVTVTDLLIIGHPALSGLYFPHYSALSVINIGDFVTNIEVIGILQFVISATIKTAVCIFAAAQGIESITRTGNVTLLIAPAVLATVVLAPVVFRSTPEMLRYNNGYKYTAAVMHVAIPTVLYIATEIRHKVIKRRERHGNRNIIPVQGH